MQNKITTYGKQKRFIGSYRIAVPHLPFVDLYSD